MAVISVASLKYGEKLSESVVTRFGNTLFHKGKIISDRDIEILRAFLIQNVSIETKSTAADESSDESKQMEDIQVSTIHPFITEYENMLNMLKQVFKLANASQPIPMMDLRNRLQALINHIDYYNLLSFSAKNWHLQDFIYHNSIMVGLTSYQLAKWCGMPEKDHMQIALAGLLHDIGTMKVDPAVLEKKEKLTQDELEEVRKHTVLGYNMLKNVPALNEGVKLCALQHHEREDGSGYPLGLKGDKIHPYAKVVAIADIYHAMSNPRYYKSSVSAYLVLEELQKESFGRLAPTIVQAMINKVTSFQNGTLVKLNDGRVGEIVFADRSHPTRPWVNVNGTIVNLVQERSVYIQDVIQ
ncbi:HD-GYP domain-containing protein [Paenibacillus chartarius]|uniref:HD-GYP domain-containing protein n=1 Tax=Paenibacillus chartarius TaxID=747481 RepID=A0ABV6DJD6_9BACL